MSMQKQWKYGQEHFLSWLSLLSLSWERVKWHWVDSFLLVFSLPTRFVHFIGGGRLVGCWAAETRRARKSELCPRSAGIKKYIASPPLSCPSIVPVTLPITPCPLQALCSYPSAPILSCQFRPTHPIWRTSGLLKGNRVLRATITIGLNMSDAIALVAEIQV